MGLTGIEPVTFAILSVARNQEGTRLTRVRATF